ncbi:MAG TPA: DUF6629 family protein [Parachlamydiaceae bacterium]|nr:DUF6629 family protein [Parachlamydiaceae bacterium]
MCFSAEASFIGAGALAIIGTATLKTSHNTKNLLWMCIPLLFAVQQFCEGVVWLELRGTIPHSVFTVFAKDLYLFFALALWLIWFPLSFMVAEPIPLRKKVLKLVLFFGFFAAVVNLSLYPILDLTPTINKFSINYLKEASLDKRLCYLAIIAFPPFISSLKYMKVFGVLIILSAVVAEYFYVSTFTSVWCFLGSFISAALYLISRANTSKVQNVQELKTVESVNENIIHK